MRARASGLMSRPRRPSLEEMMVRAAIRGHHHAPPYGAFMECHGEGPPRRRRSAVTESHREGWGRFLTLKSRGPSQALPKWKTERVNKGSTACRKSTRWHVSRFGSNMPLCKLTREHANPLHPLLIPRSQVRDLPGPSERTCIYASFALFSDPRPAYSQTTARRRGPRARERTGHVRVARGSEVFEFAASNDALVAAVDRDLCAGGDSERVVAEGDHGSRDVPRRDLRP
jgi:hypothetical protein